MLNEKCVCVCIHLSYNTCLKM